jgi:isopenicillin N synthase-like dioxygenase
MTGPGRARYALPNAEIPIVSLRGLRSGRRADLERIGAEIGRAARGLGFFSVAESRHPAAADRCGVRRIGARSSRSPPR